MDALLAPVKRRAHQPLAEVDAFDALPVRDVDGLGENLQFRHALLQRIPLHDERV
jgi:hypothetical protein